jgi:hypothetical protein
LIKPLAPNGAGADIELLSCMAIDEDLSENSDHSRKKSGFSESNALKTTFVELPRKGSGVFRLLGASLVAGVVFAAAS